jgi:hypothetical protein
MTPRLLSAALLFSFFACGSPPDLSAATARHLSSTFLGPASRFAVLGGSGVECSNPSFIAGEVGVSPGDDVADFNPESTLTGRVRAGDALAALGHNQLVTAYEDLAGLACDHHLSGDLGGRSLPAGVYCFDDDATLTGRLTLDGGRNGSAIWIFQVGGALTTAEGASVVMGGNGQACSVFWQVGGAATLGANTAFLGNLLVSDGITFGHASSLVGRALALKATVALDDNAITGSCVETGQRPCVLRDWVTGQGWLKVPQSKVKHTFSLRGGIEKNVFAGRLVYQREGPQPLKLISQTLTAYTVIDPHTRRLEGTGTLNGVAGFTWQVEVSEDHTPGSHDTFALLISNGVAAAGDLRGGEIQVHDNRGPQGKCLERPEPGEVEQSADFDEQAHAPGGLCTRNHDR